MTILKLLSRGLDVLAVDVIDGQVGCGRFRAFRSDDQAHPVTHRHAPLASFTAARAADSVRVLILDEQQPEQKKPAGKGSSAM